MATGASVYRTGQGKSGRAQEAHDDHMKKAYKM